MTSGMTGTGGLCSPFLWGGGGGDLFCLWGGGGGIALVYLYCYF
jgi:hypothetical protein